MGDNNPAPDEPASRPFPFDQGPDLQALAHFTGQSVERFLEEGFRLALEQVRRHPSSSMAHLALGREYWIRGAHLQAASSYERAANLDPHCICALLSAADAAIWIAQHEESFQKKASLKHALSRLQQILNLRPHDHQALLQAGQVAYWLEEDFEQAQDYFRRALEANPKSSEAGYYLGCLQRDLLHFEEARHWFEHALQIDPQKVDAFFELARIHLDCGEREMAMAKLEEAVRLDPQHVEADNLLGRIRQHKQIDEVVAVERAQCRAQPGEEIQDAPDIPAGIRSMARQAKFRHQTVELAVEKGEIHYTQHLSIRELPFAFSLWLEKDGSGAFALTSRSSQSELGLSLQPETAMDETVSLLRAVGTALEQDNLPAAAACLNVLKPGGVILYPLKTASRREAAVLKGLHNSLKRFDSGRSDTGWWNRVRDAITSFFRG